MKKIHMGKGMSYNCMKSKVFQVIRGNGEIINEKFFRHYFKGICCKNKDICKLNINIMAFRAYIAQNLECYNF